jgi:putative membrane protein
MTNWRRSDRTEEWLFLVAIVLFLFYLAITANTGISNLERIPFTLVVPVAAAFALTHSIYMLGWRRALALFVIATSFSSAFELTGVHTGRVFGAYCYTELLGPRIAGLPIIIPLAWYQMLYPAYVIANMIGEGRPVSLPEKRILWVVWLSLLGAMIMTAWDLTMDPVMSYTPEDDVAFINDAEIPDIGEVGVPAWRWLREPLSAGGATCATAPRLPETARTHFGVPFENFRGWMITAFVVFLVYRLVERRLPAATGAHRFRKIVVLLPITTYGAIGMLDAWLGYPKIDDVHLLSPFLMGTPFVAATMLALRMGSAYVNLPAPEAEQREETRT